MKLYAVVLLTLGTSFSVARADVKCSATRTTTVLVDDKVTSGPTTVAHEAGPMMGENSENKYGAFRFQGMHVAVQFSADFTQAYDISDYLDQMGDMRFMHSSQAVPLKMAADGSVTVSHRLALYKVGGDTENQVLITLTCKK